MWVGVLDGRERLELGDKDTAADVEGKEDIGREVAEKGGRCILGELDKVACKDKTYCMYSLIFVRKIHLTYEELAYSIYFLPAGFRLHNDHR